jgi:N6-adenosine-specific RNA methylase IME4
VIELLPADLTDLKAHEYADMFPMISEDQRPGFRADIADNGLTDEIILLDGRILDGRNRYRELKVLGWESQPHYYVTWAELVKAKGLTDDPFAYVISKNLRRRHLTDGQRAMAAARAATMRQGERNDIKPATFDPEPSANVRKVSQGQAAEMFEVSERLVTSANVVIKSGIAPLVDLVDKGKVAPSVAEQIARMPEADQQRALAENKPDALKNVAKRFDRERRAAELAQRQAALPIKKYGVIYADPEWDFIVRSVNGMDRAAANHYPVSPLEEIMARRVGDIAADDCVLFMWATVPMLIEAFMVAEAWGFMALGRDPVTDHLSIDKSKSRYVSNWEWVKTTIGNGYWGRNNHETLLIFTKGNPVAPAPGTQPRSAMHYPEVSGGPVADRARSPLLTDGAGITLEAGEHSAKPWQFREWIDKLFPTANKIELNAREAAPGWDVWGNEAPQQQENSTDEDPRRNQIASELKELAANPAAIAAALPPPVKSSPEEIERRRNDRMTKRSQEQHADAIAALETKMRSVGRDLPDDDAGLVAEYRKAIDAMDAAMIAGNKKGVLAARDRQRSIVFKCNDWKHFGSGVNERAKAIVAEADARKPSDRLKFGQCGALRISIDNPSMRAIAKFDHWSDDGLTVSVDLHATTLREEFTSETGFHSVMGVKCLGLMSIADAAIAALEQSIAYATDKKANKYAKGLTLPDTAYDIAGDGSVIVKDRRPKEETPEPSPAPAASGNAKGRKKAKVT